MNDDPVNALIPGPRCHSVGSPNGPLAGLRFAVKDLIDVAGWPTGGGNLIGSVRIPFPLGMRQWLRCLLKAGASIVGKTHTDELSLGILGENPVYGTPINPSAPGRVPGSSSGSVSAVAAGLCEFALGTNTGELVRVPKFQRAPCDWTRM